MLRRRKSVTHVTIRRAFEVARGELYKCFDGGCLRWQRHPPTTTATLGGVLVATLLALMGCQSTQQPLLTASQVDLSRLNGDWYVIANIPTFIEKQAFNAVETYELNERGRIETTFAFNKGAFDGPRKRYHPTGFVSDDPSNAVWGMQFIWPIKAEYRIMHVDDEYKELVVGRTKRDFVWIMSRTPTLDEARYLELTAMLKTEGYDLTGLRLVPQRWE